MGKFKAWNRPGSLLRVREGTGGEHISLWNEERSTRIWVLPSAFLYAGETALVLRNENPGEGRREILLLTDNGLFWTTRLQIQGKVKIVSRFTHEELEE